MKRLSATLLALGLATATIATANAQTYGGYNGYPNTNGYNRTVPDRYGNANGAIYDYARVLRVDPVIDSRYGNNGYPNNRYASNNGYTNVNGQRCYESSGRYGNNGDVNNYGTYRNDPYYPQQNGQYGTTTGRTMATVIGGIAGAVLGSKVGGGSGTYAATAIGSMVGGMAGRQIYESSQRRRYEGNTVQVCDPVYDDGHANNGYYGNNGYASNNINDGRVVGYDVTYEYAGRQFVTRTDYHPGDRIRVRVDVRPE